MTRLNDRGTVVLAGFAEWQARHGVELDAFLFMLSALLQDQADDETDAGAAALLISAAEHLARAAHNLEDAGK